MSAKYWHRLSHEQDLWRQGLSLVAGVDEAGCGPLAGPVVAAAVVFPCCWLESGLCRKLRGLNDSKQLTAEEREKYFAVLTSLPEIRYAIASMDVETIDRINIRQAAWRAMNVALDMLEPRPQHVLVDGLRIRWLPYAQTALVGGDARSYTIARRERARQGHARPASCAILKRFIPGMASEPTRAITRRSIWRRSKPWAHAPSIAAVSGPSGLSKRRWSSSPTSPRRKPARRRQGYRLGLRAPPLCLKFPHLRPLARYCPGLTTQSPAPALGRLPPSAGRQRPTEIARDPARLCFRR
jgi:hypothetical protein